MIYDTTKGKEIFSFFEFYMTWPFTNFPPNLITNISTYSTAN